jgi:branched-chain amino acid transport system permease protein
LLPDTAPAATWFIWGVLWVVLIWAVFLIDSPLGRMLKAIHSDEEAAAAVGINVFCVKLGVFVLSGVLAALAGVLYAFVYSPSYLGPEEFHILFSVMLLAMVVIGGMGSIWGGLVGAVLLTGLHEIIALVCGYFHLTQVGAGEHLIYGLLLVLTLIFWPRGVMHGVRHSSLWLMAQWRRWHG